MSSARTNYYWRIAGFYFFYFAFVGMFSPYWSLYLKSISFSAVQIGVLMSVQPVMRMLSPALWGWLADRWGNRRQVVQLAALGSALCYLGVFFTRDYYGLLLVLALMSFFWSASMPLVEATTLTYLGKQAARYGRLRSWGSIGFIVSVLGLGYAFDYIAIGWILWAGLLIQLGILFFSRQIPPTEIVAHHTDSHSIRSIVMQPQVLTLLGGCALMAVAHGPYYTFFSIYLVEHGYAKSAVGALWTLGVVCEIGVFFAMPWLMRRFSLPHMLMLSMALAVLRFLLIAWQVDTLW
jgi:PPP family 3-phenylpropionic acid transporter